MNLTVAGIKMRINKRVDYVLYSRNSNILKFCIQYYIFDERNAKRV